MREFQGSPVTAIHVIASVHDEASGPTYCVLRTLEELNKLGMQAQVAALDWQPGTSSPDGVRLFPLGYGPRRLGRSPAMLCWLRRQVTKGEIGIIHNHGLWMMPNVYAGQLDLGEHCRLIVSPHGTFAPWAMSRSGFRKFLFKALCQAPTLSRAACYHATSVTEYRDIRNQGYRQPVALIPFGIDIPEYRSKHPSERRKLLFLGRLHPVKGVDTLLRAWGVVSRKFPEWDLEIVGPGEPAHVEPLQSMAQSLRLERAYFKGPAYGSVKQAYYEKAELFVLPSHTENFGVAVAEALAISTPAIVTKGAPWAGLEKHGAGWWIDLGLDPLVACLEDAMSRSPRELAQMGCRGRNWVEDEFSWVRIGQQMAETYRWLLYPCKDAPSWILLD